MDDVMRIALGPPTEPILSISDDTAAAPEPRAAKEAAGP
jgi:hypothetical protein